MESNDQVRIVINNQTIETTAVGNASGIGIRVLKDGSWGFAWGSLSDGEQLTKMALKSVVLTSKFKKEDVSLEEKVKITLEIDKTMARGEDIKSTKVIYREVYRHATFASSEGALIETIVPAAMLPISVHNLKYHQVSVNSGL